MQALTDHHCHMGLYVYDGASLLSSKAWLEQPACCYPYTLAQVSMAGNATNTVSWQLVLVLLGKQSTGSSLILKRTVLNSLVHVRDC